VREAIIALEVQGLIEVRIGSGAYVKRLPGSEDLPGFDVSAFELTEARLLFEGEAAALAAMQVTDEELAEIERLVEAIARENDDPRRHRTGGPRVSSRHRQGDAQQCDPRCDRAPVGTRAQPRPRRRCSTEGRAGEYKAGGRRTCRHPRRAARARSRGGAAAMRGHLSQVIDSLLFATEERQIEEARRGAQAKRDRYSRATALIRPLELHPDRLFPADPARPRRGARALRVGPGLPIISPHGHTDPVLVRRERELRQRDRLPARARSLRVPHALLAGRGAGRIWAWAIRMSIRARPGGCLPSAITCSAARRRGSGSTWVFAEAFGIDGPASGQRPPTTTSTRITSSACASERFVRRALFERFNIEALATTESPLDTLEHHAADPQPAAGVAGRDHRPTGPIRWSIPNIEGFRANLEMLVGADRRGSHEPVADLAAHRQRRAFFAATGRDQHRPWPPHAALTANLSRGEAEAPVPEGHCSRRVHRHTMPSCSARRC
jgi:GntR family transcriptional repressor for pyruvate dehydrogenase complex